MADSMKFMLFKQGQGHPPFQLLELHPVTPLNCWYLSALFYSVPWFLCSSPPTLPARGLPLPSLLQASVPEGTTLHSVCTCRVCDPAMGSSQDRKLLGDGDRVVFVCTPKQSTVPGTQ